MPPAKKASLLTRNYTLRVAEPVPGKSHKSPHPSSFFQLKAKPGQVWGEGKEDSREGVGFPKVKARSLPMHTAGSGAATAGWTVTMLIDSWFQFPGPGLQGRVGRGKREGRLLKPLLAAVLQKAAVSHLACIIAAFYFLPVWVADFSN